MQYFCVTAKLTFDNQQGDCRCLVSLACCSNALDGFATAGQPSNIIVWLKSSGGLCYFGCQKQQEL